MYDPWTLETFALNSIAINNKIIRPQCLIVFKSALTWFYMYNSWISNVFSKWGDSCRITEFVKNEDCLKPFIMGFHHIYHCGGLFRILLVTNLSKLDACPRLRSSLLSNSYVILKCVYWRILDLRIIVVAKKYKRSLLSLCEKSVCHSNSSITLDLGVLSSQYHPACMIVAVSWGPAL